MITNLEQVVEALSEAIANLGEDGFLSARQKKEMWTEAALKLGVSVATLKQLARKAEYADLFIPANNPFFI